MKQLYCCRWKMCTMIDFWVYSRQLLAVYLGVSVIKRDKSGWFVTSSGLDFGQAMPPFSESGGQLPPPPRFRRLCHILYKPWSCTMKCTDSSCLLFHTRDVYRALGTISNLVHVHVECAKPRARYFVFTFRLKHLFPPYPITLAIKTRPRFTWVHCSVPPVY